MKQQAKEAGPVKYGTPPPPVRGIAAVVIPPEFTPRGSPIEHLPLPSGVNARSLRYSALFNEMAKLNIGITAIMGKQEMLQLYQDKLLVKADELSGGRIGPDDIERAAKALAK